MQKKNIIILFIISILFFALSLVGVYVYGQTTLVWHSAGEIRPGSFQQGTYTFPDKVGIGTTSPGAKLHISGGNLRISHGSSEYGIELQRESNNGYAKVLWVESKSPTSPLVANSTVLAGFGGAGLSLIGNHANPSASFGMYINQYGNVGIGTTSPGAKLDISAAQSGTPGNLTIKIGDYYGFRYNYTGGSAYLYLDRNWYGWQSEPYMTFKADTGNVGIGTTAPRAKLDVNGKIKLKGIDASGKAGILQVDCSSGSCYAVYAP